MSSNMDINSQIDLYDSDILAMERGPLRYAKEREGSSMSIDGFVNALTEQFAQIGLKVLVMVMATNVEGAYGFAVEIQGRIEKHEFDHDRMVHEVTSNILHLPGQDGFINTQAALANSNRELWTPKKHKGHGHG